MSDTYVRGVLLSEMPVLDILRLRMARLSRYDLDRFALAVWRRHVEREG